MTVRIPEPKCSESCYTLNGVWYHHLDCSSKLQDRGFITKDSGVREEYPSGMRRDTQQGKPDYTLCDLPMLKRWAELMTRGADKYGRENWRKANSPDELERFKSSAFRHFIQWLDGETDEDHGAAVFFNIAAAEAIRRKINNDTISPSPSSLRVPAVGGTSCSNGLLSGRTDG